MAKFNVFDERTWDLELEDKEKLLRNKALGQLGQLISEIRGLFNTINKASLDSVNDNQDLKIALDLESQNPVAFKIMKVNIYYPNPEIAEILGLINKVLDFWNDKELRETNWRHAVKLIQPLKPFLEKERSYFISNYQKQAVDDLVSIKITGNAAWKLYLSTQKNLEYWKKKYEEKSQDNISNHIYDPED